MSPQPKALILFPEVTGVVGGTERLAETLYNALKSKGISSDIFTLPYQWEPKEIVISEALKWRMLEPEADLVIPLKFPAYFVRHPRKIPWLQHQYRQIYEFHGTPFSGFSNNLPDGEFREKLVAFDTACLAESAHIYTNSVNTLSRLQRFNGLDGSVLFPPPFRASRTRETEYGSFLLAVGRLEEVKRTDLLLRAVALAESDVHVKIAGTGSQLGVLRRLAVELSISDRIEFLGFVEDEELADLYARCRAVHFAPKDEDYGLIAVEAMTAAKLVITAADSGGPLELVRDGDNGFVAEATPKAQANAIDRLWTDVELCERMGAAAAASVKRITWDKTVAEICRWLP